MTATLATKHHTLAVVEITESTCFGSPWFCTHSLHKLPSLAWSFKDMITGKLILHEQPLARLTNDTLLAHEALYVAYS